jgi:hypothetical protein
VTAGVAAASRGSLSRKEWRAVTEQQHRNGGVGEEVVSDFLLYRGLFGWWGNVMGNRKKPWCFDLGFMESCGFLIIMFLRCKTGNWVSLCVLKCAYIVVCRNVLVIPLMWNVWLVWFSKQARVCFENQVTKLIVFEAMGKWVKCY